jgi:hypothetical protein
MIKATAGFADENVRVFPACGAGWALQVRGTDFAFDGRCF